MSSTRARKRRFGIFTNERECVVTVRQDDEEQAAPVKTKWAGLVIGVKTN